jgi:hypothetical protein
MLKKSITYTDYDGNERTEDFYFNLTKAECVELKYSEIGGLENYIEALIRESDNKRIIALFKDLIFRAYGEKSPDGRRFIKSSELSEAFAQTEAYSNLFMELASDAEAAAQFVNGITPVVDESAVAEKMAELKDSTD